MSYELDDELDELESAEEFLDYFAVPFEADVVKVNRLHILQRFHDYIQTTDTDPTAADEVRKPLYREALARAYQDFVESDAQTEKVFKVFRMGEPQEVSIPITSIGKAAG